MKLEVRKLLLDKASEPQVLDDKGVRSGLIQEGRVIKRLLKLLILDQNIHCNENLDAAKMGIIDCRLHRLVVKVSCINSRIKRATADIYGVRSVFNCSYKLLLSARRHEKLYTSFCFCGH